MYEIDLAATRWLNGLAGGDLDRPMIWLSAAGIPVLVLLVAAQWWMGSDRRALRHVVAAAGLSFLVGLALNQLILLSVDRERPYVSGLTHLLVGPSADPSFPSDHATAAFAIAAAFLLHGLWRRGWGFLAAAGLVAVSRVYVGTHYVGDVAGGVATGLMAAAIVRLAYARNTRVDQFITRLF